jgi:hypothetical protein
MAVLDILTPAPKRTLEETQQILQAIKDYNNALDNLNLEVKTMVDKDQLLPDTATYLYKIIIDAQKWLKNNPRADVSTIQINLANAGQQFKAIRITEGFRIISMIGLAVCATIIFELVKSKLITPTQEKEFKNSLKTYLTWFKANAFTATPSEFEKQLRSNQKELEIFFRNDPKIGEKVQTISKDVPNFNNLKIQEIVKLTTDALNKIGLQSPTQTSAEAKNMIKLENMAAVAAAPSSATAIIMSTASQAFGILFLIFLILIGGSFAANLAIGRTAPYRVLYFIYGCIPFFSPFIILYVIYLRIRYGPVPLYGIFPLSTNPATSRIGKILWYPFYWIPDGKSSELEQQFLKSLIV